ncbi:peptidase S8 [Thermoleptolyngbya oregonensis NK1-22]|uniref:Peptidase S8 n=1 Tax=Thermoleptolyngbya oregonensis NK1-22 TaxID=2547457 RepID=A0AA96Y829_9CYAN|nr:S8 family peptidase [Thermoleptolyngbya oregonensis]WOB45464.1 peptidase S8 [Thermoleptolyngbya oregonensis NK1-22]
MGRLWWIGLFLAGLILALGHVPGLGSRGEYESIVLDFRDDLTAAEVEQQLGAIAQQFSITPRLNSAFSKAEQVYILPGDKQTLRALRRSDLRRYTESIDPNYIYRTLDVPNDPDYPKQWNLQTLQMESAWNESKGAGTTIAVIDTGIAPVPDLQQTKFVPGYDFVNDREEAIDDNGHGTHVAGTIAQSTNNNLGVAGIAYKASLMPLKVLGAEGGGTVTDIAEAIRFAADHGADVINLSLGGGGDAGVMRDAIDYAHGKGVVIVAAAGNANTNAAGFPARYGNVIAVSAVDATGAKAPYSNFGAGVDIAAPGGAFEGENDAGGILQQTIDPETGEPVFRAFQGTSMAAPHVAAVAALVKSVGITEPEAIAQILKSSARQVTEDPLNHFGAGRLDANAAVRLAQQENLDVKDFLRWLRDNGYLNLRFWFDGGAVALLPKLGMVLGSYLLAWLLRRYVPVLSLSLGLGLVAGSSGFFPFRGFYIYDLPQYPFRLLGSSIPELGGAISGSAALNPLFASVLIPFGLVALLLGHAWGKWVAIGATLGVAACLGISAVVDPQVMGLGAGAIARGYLALNALLCVGLATLAAKAAARA